MLSARRHLNWSEYEGKAWERGYLRMPSDGICQTADPVCQMPSDRWHLPDAASGRGLSGRRGIWQTTSGRRRLLDAASGRRHLLDTASGRRHLVDTASGRRRLAARRQTTVWQTADPVCQMPSGRGPVRQMASARRRLADSHLADGIWQTASGSRGIWQTAAGSQTASARHGI